jgi:hypothetical protein
MSKLLFDEQPIVVDRTLAKAIGLNEAIVLQQVHYWITINKEANKHFYEGRYWVYNTLADWHKNNFAFWSFDTVKRTFAKLVKAKILITGNFNKDKRDRTKWYTIDYEKLEEYVNRKSAKCTNAKVQNAPMEESKMHQPIPENTTEITNRDYNNNNSSNDEEAVVVEKNEKNTVKAQSHVSAGDDCQKKEEATSSKEDIAGKIESVIGQRIAKKILQSLEEKSLNRAIEAYKVISKGYPIKNPAGFFVYLAREGIEPPRPAGGRRQSFNQFEQHDWDPELLKSLWEPIGL